MLGTAANNSLNFISKTPQVSPTILDFRFQILD
jgi:hypothetical protein